MHKITIFSKCFSKIESGSACSIVPVLQLSDGLSWKVGATAVRHSGYKVKSKSEEAEFSRAIVLKAQTILSTSLKAEAYIKKQSKAMHVKWRKDCWSELDFRKGKKEFKMPAKLDSSLKHCHSHDHCWNIYEASPFINFRTAMIMSNFGTTVVNVKKEDISIIACWRQNLNLVDDSLSRFDRQVIEEKTWKGKPQNATHMMSEFFPSSTFWISTLFLKTCIQKMIGQLCVSCHTGALAVSWSL